MFRLEAGPGALGGEGEDIGSAATSGAAGTSGAGRRRLWVWKDALGFFLTFLSFLVEGSAWASKKGFFKGAASNNLRGSILLTYSWVHEHHPSMPKKMMVHPVHNVWLAAHLCRIFWGNVCGKDSGVEPNAIWILCTQHFRYMLSRCVLRLKWKQPELKWIW